ncbi:hypothetical protein AABD46_24760 (plasmid) [Vibrio parahaemolyticus]|uniref:Uncharacterized protein n=1 Tax=Vibrio parahaemolyticus TaxID=670 RepID=A0AA47JN93_VIBPH|nr:MULTISPECIES: hypothetical protein [Vibrio]MBE3780299.1 hypothetical protein [Vibrio parahaemolyticus]MCZ6249824.1 hypothetical protein [Vibrio parahaemolyticus]MCZ6279508.1 hypothetical protein [Vibrio parahaemolyticus]MDE0552130.1 hypothetical protein [Vibrio sp. VP6]MDF5496048.1 hypothetical protein [Vibrio parahaemolyticus]
MSKAPAWLDKANQNKTGNTVGNAAEVGQVRSKPGPKKALVERKSVGLKFSAARNDEISKLETLLKQNGYAISRGRSEAVEVAVSVLLQVFENKENIALWDGFITETIGKEERDKIT